MTKSYKKPHISFKKYLRSVLKRAHPDLGISKKGMDIMNDITIDLFNRIALTGTNLCASTSKKTLSLNDIDSACKLTVGG